MTGAGNPQRNWPTSVGQWRHPRLKLAVWLLLCGLPGFGALKMWLAGGASWPLWCYGGASLLAFFLYWRDKRKARSGTWRTPEKILHGVELLGGWPGALIAQQVLRHKTRKPSFQWVFWAIVLLHQVFWIDQLFLDAGLTRLSFL